MQFFYNHPYLSAISAIILLNVIAKKITQSKRSPIGWALLSITALLGQACSPFSGVVNKEISNSYYYSKSGEQIRYSPAGNWFELGNSEMKADVASFTPLEREFAKDKNHIFFKADIIDDEVDVSTFRVVDRLGFDKNNVYIPLAYMAYAISDTLPKTQKMFVLKGADPETYHETEDWDWGKDAKNWFYGYKMIAVDYESFTPANKFFCKDDHRVYMRTSFDLIPCEIDPKTFEIINDRYVADKNYIYDFAEWSDGEEENKLNKFSYQSLENLDASDKDYLYFDNAVLYDGLLMEDANRKDFKVLESATNAYAKNKQHVYYDGQKIVGADVETFKLYDYDQYGSDKNSVYHWGVKMEGADVATFEAIEKDGWVYRDKNHTYAGAEISED